MLKRLSVHMRSNVVAYLALFLALGGVGAYAADKVTSKDIAKNAVKSKHIKASAVKTGDVKDNNLTGGDVADGSIGTADLAGGSVTGAKIAAGVIPDTGVVARSAIQDDVDNGSTATDSVTCEAGEHAVGGGAGFVNASDQHLTNDTTINGSIPIGAGGGPVADGAVPTGWRASGENVNAGADRFFVVTVLCAKD